MSFKSNDINLSNYEEYFLMYVDNELTTEERQMVDAFVLAHPELQLELDLFMNTKLPVEDISFNFKEELYSKEMKKEVIDENLLLYLDNELAGTEKTKIEEQLASDKSYQGLYNILLQTKLNPADTIVYPNKKELYRSTHRVVPFTRFLRVAAAAVIILTAAGLYLTRSDEPVTVAVNQPTQTTKPNNTVANSNPVNTTTNTVPVTTKEEVRPVINTTEVINNQVATLTKHEVTTPTVQPATVQPQEEPVTEPRTVEPLGAIAANTEEAVAPQIIPDKTPVTSSIAQTYNNQETSGGYSTAEEDTKPRGSLKGFFRKATRLIERNTGIDATNGENEILIGSVAVRLK